MHRLFSLFPLEEAVALKEDQGRHGSRLSSGRFAKNPLILAHFQEERVCGLDGADVLLSGSA